MFIKNQKIKINKLILKKNHGVYEFEQNKYTKFCINIEIALKNIMAIETDKLEDTLDYQKVVEITKIEFNKRSNLIENIGYRIAKKIIDIEYVDSVKLEIMKISPPIEVEIESTSYEIELLK